MRKFKPIILLSSILLFTQVSWATPPTPVDINAASYSVGYKMGVKFHHQNIDINLQEFVQGFTDAIKQSKPKVSDEKMNSLIEDFKKYISNKIIQERQQLADKNEQSSKNFFKENQSKTGVKSLKSGLQYKVIQPGTGSSPSKKDDVVINYTGRLLNGHVFDERNDPKNPITLSLEQVIPGWKEALPLMKTGAIWELYIPPNMAYGARGFGRQIGPNETLIFTVSLLDIKKK